MDTDRIFRKIQCTRRDFLAFLTASAVSGILFQPSRLIAADTPHAQCLVVGSGKGVALANLATNEVTKIDLGFSPHSFIQHPHYPKRFIAIEKWGTGGTEIDFETGTVINIDGNNQNQMYGHGFYNEAKDCFFITRVDVTNGNGYLSGFDRNSLKKKYDYWVTPGGLHDCHRMSDGSYLVACSGVQTRTYLPPIHNGEKVATSSLKKIDVDGDGKILAEMKIKDEDQILGHFAVTKTNQILALSGPSYAAGNEAPGKLYYSPDAKAPLEEIPLPEDVLKNIKGEMLSVALNKRESRAAVTNPMGKIILLIDMKRGRFIKAVNETWRGVAFNPQTNQFVGTNPGLETIEADFSDLSEIVFQKPTDADHQIELSGAHSLLRSL